MNVNVKLKAEALVPSVSIREEHDEEDGKAPMKVSARSFLSPLYAMLFFLMIFPCFATPKACLFK